MRLNLHTKLTDFYSKHSQIVNNMGWLFFDKILRMGVGLIVGVWVARYLGVQDFGSLNYAIAITAITGVFASMGIESLVVKLLVENKDDTSKIVSTAFILKLGGSIFGVLLTIVYACFFNGNLVLILILSLGFVFQSIDVIDFYNQSLMNAKKTVILRSISFILVTILRVYAILNHLPIEFFAWIMTLEFFISFILLCSFLKRNTLLLTNFDKKTAIYYLKNGFPLLISGVTTMIYMRIDQVMIGNMRTDSEVGIYAAAVKVAELAYIIPTILCASVFPKIVASLNIEINYFENKIKKVFFILFWLSIFSTFFIYVMSEFILNLLYGSDFNDSSIILKIYSLTNVFVFMGVAINYVLIALSKTNITFYRTVIGAVSSVFFNFLLIHKFGNIGAALSMVFSQFTTVFVLLFFSEGRKILLSILNSILNFKNVT